MRVDVWVHEEVEEALCLGLSLQLLHLRRLGRPLVLAVVLVVQDVALYRQNLCAAIALAVVSVASYTCSSEGKARGCVAASPRPSQTRAHA